MTEIPIPDYHMCYKIVTAAGPPSRERFFSILAYGKAMTEYFVGSDAIIPTWLAHIGHYPTVFSNIKYALRFGIASTLPNELSPSIRLYLCKCRDRVELPQIFDVMLLSENMLSINESMVSWPPGTEMYKRVELITDATDELRKEHKAYWGTRHDVATD